MSPRTSNTDEVRDERSSALEGEKESARKTKEYRGGEGGTPLRERPAREYEPRHVDTHREVVFSLTRCLLVSSVKLISHP
jgi:hypothetical protein